jgi:hypothetical protein
VIASEATRRTVPARLLAATLKAPVMRDGVAAVAGDDMRNLHRPISAREALLILGVRQKYGMRPYFTFGADFVDLLSATSDWL